MLPLAGTCPNGSLVDEGLRQKCQSFNSFWMGAVCLGYRDGDRRGCQRKNTAACSGKSWKRVNFWGNPYSCHAVVASDELTIRLLHSQPEIFLKAALSRQSSWWFSTVVSLCALFRVLRSFFSFVSMSLREREKESERVRSYEHTPTHPHIAAQLSG